MYHFHVCYQIMDKVRAMLRLREELHGKWHQREEYLRKQLDDRNAPEIKNLSASHQVSQITSCTSNQPFS